MIEVRYRDRLGNNLFQYALGRILAEELGFALQAKPLEGFPGTNQKIAGSEYGSPVEVFEGHRIDLNGLLANRQPRRIVLNGWFQRHEYFTPYRDRIKSWFKLDSVYDTPCTNADVVVNVRRTDYVNLGWALPFSYYEEAIERVLPRGGRVSIVTDDPLDTFFLRFRRWRPSFFKGTPFQQISYMSHAPRLVMSPSTFSWWPTFLGRAETVVCPLHSVGVWSPVGVARDSNLIEQDRFICIDCSESYYPNSIEKLYQRLKYSRFKFIFRLKKLRFQCL
jgi:hypothetical protein